MNCHVIIGILCIIMFIRSCALDYSILENLEVTCLPRDNCIMVNSHQFSFENRSCECDSQCNRFQDCCIDKANIVSLVTRRARQLSCMAYGGQHRVGVYVVDTCPHNYRDSSDIRSLCQEGDDFWDPLASAPVTLVSENKTFKNRYCAECNGASPSALENWKIYLLCETLIPLHINDSYIWQNIQYNNSLMTWGVQLQNVFHTCDLIFEKPENLTGVRFCRANTIDSCPPSYLRLSVKKLCSSYSAVVYDLENAYKNPHCAICNNRTLNNLTCMDSSLFIRKAKPFTFAHLLDVNPRDGDRVGIVDAGDSCPADQKWDPFFKKCRKLSCVLPGFAVVDGKCKKE